jgi:membrane associated rhomboid family serine protease
VIPIKDNIPTDRFPVVTLGLIIANVVVYLLAIGHEGSFFGGPSEAVLVKYGAIPYSLTHPGAHLVPNGIPAWETVFTSMFMHASFLHIAGNMIFLWIFGGNVEDSMGRIRYLCFYILGGIVALALQIAVAPNSVVPTIGASGAIAAVLGGYILLYPRARVITFVIIIFFVTVIELPAFVLLGAWFALQALFGAAGLTHIGSGAGVAYFAHIGGFAFGLATIKLWATRRKQVPPPSAPRSLVA